MLRYFIAQWARQAAQQGVRSAVESAARAELEGAQEDTEPPPPAEVIFVYAMAAEAGGLVDLLSGCVTSRCASFVEHRGVLAGRQVAIIETGVGREAAATATQDVIAMHRPAWVISAGFAGALDPDLRRGQILMADEVVDTSGRTLSIGMKFDPAAIEGSPGLSAGRLLTVDHLIRTATEKRQLGETHRAMACEMETYAVAETCSREKVRFLAVRVISDALEDELPQEIERLLDQKSLASKLGAATGAIFKRPSSLKDMWGLKEQALRASDRLAKFVATLVPRLG